MSSCPAVRSWILTETSHLASRTPAPPAAEMSTVSPFIEYGDSKVLAMAERRLSMQRVPSNLMPPGGHGQQQVPNISHMHYAGSVSHTPSPYPRTPSPAMPHMQHGGDAGGYAPFAQYASQQQSFQGS